MAGLYDPLISWYYTDTDKETSDWQLGTIKAGSAADLNAKGFFIWNNRGGGEARYKAMDCKLTTQDTAGNMTIPLVREKWVKVKCVSMGESNFSEIGANDSGGGNWVDVSKSIKATGSGAASGEILGDINDGKKETQNSQNCFSEVVLKIGVPATASAGNVPFLVRLYYDHV